jgi:hypothetical protein
MVLFLLYVSKDELQGKWLFLSTEDLSYFCLLPDSEAVAKSLENVVHPPPPPSRLY